jgi:hypothetical protein
LRIEWQNSQTEVQRETLSIHFIAVSRLSVEQNTC